MIIRRNRMRTQIIKENQFCKDLTLENIEEKIVHQLQTQSLIHVYKMPSSFILFRYNHYFSHSHCLSPSALIPFTMGMNKRLQLLQMFNNESDTPLHTHTHTHNKKTYVLLPVRRQWFEHKKSFTF